MARASRYESDYGYNERMAWYFTIIDTSTMFTMIAGTFLFFVLPHEGQLKNDPNAAEMLHRFHRPGGMLPEKVSIVGVLYYAAHVSFVVGVGVLAMAYSMIVEWYVARS